MTKYKIAVSQYELAQKIPDGSPFWPKFNAGFNNYEIEPEIIHKAVYDGRAITTWHKDHWRTGTNYICGQHLGLDMDTKDEQSTIPYLVKDKFISKYASFLYTTISHLPEAPRARVIFLIDNPIMQSCNYALAAQSLVWLFSMADTKCRDAVRFFYGCQNCTMEILGNVLPLETIKHLIAQYQDTGHKEKKRSEYHAPAEMKEVEDALKLIPAWGIEYDEWVNVLMAIHSQFGDAGYSLAESWGEGKRDEVSRKWKSFKAEGNTAGAVTIATLFNIAKRFGWYKSIDR
jgi:hypothetical protein